MQEEKNETTVKRPPTETELLQLQIEALKTQLEKTEKEHQDYVKSFEVFDFASVAKAIEHFTYTDHTGRTASQVVLSLGNK